MVASTATKNIAATLLRYYLHGKLVLSPLFGHEQVLVGLRLVVDPLTHTVTLGRDLVGVNLQVRHASFKPLAVPGALEPALVS